MPCRRVLKNPDSSWDTVLIPTNSVAGYGEFHDFIDGDESTGFYTCFSRVSKKNPQSTDWQFSFSDSRTAFAFKMKFFR